MKNVIFGCGMAAALLGCTVSDDTKGSVYQFNGETVTIRGAYDMDLSGRPAQPTPAMIA